MGDSLQDTEMLPLGAGWCCQKRRNTAKPFLDAQGITTLFIRTAQLLIPGLQASVDQYILGMSLTASSNLPSSLQGFQSVFSLLPLLPEYFSVYRPQSISGSEVNTVDASSVSKAGEQSGSC